MSKHLIYRSANCDVDAVRGLERAFERIGFASGGIRGNGDCHGFRATRDDLTLTVDWYYGGLLEITTEADVEPITRERISSVVANQPDVNRPVI